MTCEEACLFFHTKTKSLPEEVIGVLSLPFISYWHNVWAWPSWNIFDGILSFFGESGESHVVRLKVVVGICGWLWWTLFWPGRPSEVVGWWYGDCGGARCGRTPCMWVQWLIFLDSAGGGVNSGRVNAPYEYRPLCVSPGSSAYPFSH